MMMMTSGKLLCIFCGKCARTILQEGGYGGFILVCGRNVKFLVFIPEFLGVVG